MLILVSSNLFINISLEDIINNKAKMTVSFLLNLIFLLGHSLTIYIKTINIPPKIIKIIIIDKIENW